MLTRREVLTQLKRVGVKTLSEMKRDCREFEQHMLVNYDYEIIKKPGRQLKEYSRSRQRKPLSTPEKSPGDRPRKLVITRSGNFSSPSVGLKSNQFEKDPQS